MMCNLPSVDSPSFKGPVDKTKRHPKVKYFPCTIPGNACSRAALLSMVDFPSNHAHDPIELGTQPK